MFSGNPKGKMYLKILWEFSDPVVRTLLFHCMGPGFDGRVGSHKLHGGEKFSHIFYYNTYSKRKFCKCIKSQRRIKSNKIPLPTTS